MTSSRTSRDERIDYKVSVLDSDDPNVVSHVLRFYKTSPHVVGTLELKIPDSVLRPSRQKFAAARAKKNRDGS